ncbi:MAG: asparagine synthase (glutamine-hydrolyzing), partial [Gemmatimonadota bacterium]
MCGIAGVVSTSAATRPLAREVGDAMAGRLQHRGPDGRTGYESPSGRCVLGHTRLAVIDLDTGDQPMPNEDGTVQVVFNGEIYNFRRLRDELEDRGHRFRSRSDTEVLAHGWEEWGERLVGRLEGMFAFAVWDERSGTLFIARDRAGQKPVFLYRDRGRLAFASEIKSLLALPDADDALDPTAFPLYLAYGYVPQPDTFYERIQALPPATWLRIDTGSRREVVEGYWRLDFGERLGKGVGGGIDDAAKRLRDLMRGAVERRLIADVPLGAFLSGGIDSSVVVGLMSEIMDRPVRTFS